MGKITSWIGAFLAAAVLLPVAANAAENAKKPNVVIMLVDNMGYGDIGAFGGLRAKTPNIDKLAKEGVVLRDFQVETWCTPSRAALMTGRLPVRSGTTLNGPVGAGLSRTGIDEQASAASKKGKARANPQDSYGLDPREVTLAEILKRSGYNTALFGKWHLGYAPDRQPQAQGFDEFYGVLGTSGPLDPRIPGFADVMPAMQAIVSAKRGETAQKVGDLTYEMRARFDRELTKLGVEYIRSQAASGNPFFVLVSYVNVHNPVVPHPDFEGKSGGGAYTDVLMEIDHNSGQILQTLKELGLEEDTIVIWASDNGATRRSPDPEQNADPGPWSGDLGSTWEGSLRTAAMIRWPGRIRADWVNDEMFHIMDFYATLAAVTGSEVPTDRPIDSINQAPYLLGETPEAPRESRIVHIANEVAAVRYKQFKVHFITIPRYMGLLSAPTTLGIPEFYNLRTDPKELSNIASRSGGMPLAATIKARVLQPYEESLKDYPNLDYSKFKRSN